MPNASRWPDAVLAGFASSMRTFAAPGALAARGRISGKARVAALLASAGELVFDKTPAAEDRIRPPFVAGRMAAGAHAGHAIAGPVGVAAGSAGAFAGTYATWRARGLVVRRTGWPDPVVAVGEDLVAATSAAVATRPDPDPEPAPRPSLLRGVAIGLAAGLAGTAAMTIAQGAEFVLTPAEPSSVPAEVAAKIKRRLGGGRITRRHRPAVNQAMHWLYGTSWGVPLGIVAHGTDVRPEILGPAFGTFVWGAGLAHQPALGVADLPWKRSPASLAGEALFHLVYGTGAAAALRALR